MLRIIFNWKLWLLLAVVVGVVFFRPEIIPHPLAREKAMQLRDQFMATDSARYQQILGLTDQAKNTAVTVAKNTELPSEMTGLPEEVVVEEYVSHLTDEVKKLPQNQLKQVKIEFCQDVIDEATASGTGN